MNTERMVELPAKLHIIVPVTESQQLFDILTTQFKAIHIDQQPSKSTPDLRRVFATFPSVNEAREARNALKDHVIGECQFKLRVDWLRQGSIPFVRDVR